MSAELMIVHVSDLHFAGELYPPGSRPLAALAAPSGSSTPVFQGLHPHDIGSCEELENAVKDLVRTVRAKKTILVATGDLTARGDDSEFVMSLSYLRGRLRRGWDEQMGLGPWVSSVVAIPGNHDHWKASLSSAVVRPGPATAVYRYFPSGSSSPGSWLFHEVFQSGQISLQVGGIDSCGGPGLTLAARSSIDPTALADLGRAMQIADAQAAAQRLKSIRILLLHHSPAYTATVSGWLHELSAPCKQHLSQFCSLHKIHFVLTGHLHEPLLAPAGAPNAPILPVELRCGTSLQLRAPHNRFGNTFLSHVVEPVNGGVRWSTDVYQRIPSGPFVRARKMSYSKIV